MTHPLLGVLLAAARGRPPAPDGAVEVLPGLPGPVDAVLAFTAHHLVVADVDPALVAERLPDGDLSAPMSPAFLAWLGGLLGSRPGSLDVVLAAEGLGGPPPLELAPVAHPGRHPRVVEALRHRRDLEVWTEPLFAQVAAGNAASLRAPAAAGFRPLGAEVLFDRAG
jgi:hypothetical protein